LTPLMMLLITPVGTLIEPSVGRAMVVGRTSLMILDREMSLTMLETVSGSPVAEGRSVGRTSLTMLLTRVGTDPSRMLLAAVGTDPSRMLLIAPVGRSVGRTSLTMLDREMSLTMLETVSGSPVNEGISVERTSLMMVVAAPGRSVTTPPTTLVTSLGMLVKGRSVGPGKSVN
jgi:hypothetical protein